MDWMKLIVGSLFWGILLTIALLIVVPSLAGLAPQYISAPTGIGFTIGSILGLSIGALLIKLVTPYLPSSLSKYI